MQRIITIVFVIAAFSFTADAEVGINPGDTYVPETVSCTDCPPDRMSDVKVVDQSGGGDYTNIKDAAAAAQPGRTILVKNGTYNRNVEFTTDGTAQNPIILKPYPGHKPKIDFTGSPDNTPRVEINAEHVMVEGFEITGGYDGIKVSEPYVRIKDNHIHNNSNQGILIVNAGHATIENNHIASNGAGPGECLIDGVSSSKHCHGIYFSNYKCRGANSYNTVKKNFIEKHGGAAIQFNGFDDGACTQSFVSNVIANNKFSNNGVGMYIFYKFNGNEIRDNVFTVTEDVREYSSDNTPTHLKIWQSSNNQIKKNIFHTNQSWMYALQVFDTISADNDVDDNMWMNKRDYWKWSGSWRSDWDDYQTVSGWDPDGYVGEPVNGW